jgi:DNA polymerase elongation subunit (family B)
VSAPWTSFDIETCPQEDLLLRMANDPWAWGFRPAANTKAEDAIGRQMDGWVRNLPKTCSIDPALGRVASVAFTSHQGERKVLCLGDFMGASSQVPTDEDERALLAAVREYMNRFPCIVGFNSEHFDMPWLLKRAFLLHRPSKDGRTLAAFNRWKARKYSPWPHLDLRNVLNGWGQDSGDEWRSLEVWCRLLGLEGKTKGKSSEVRDMVRDGKWTRLKAYNQEDADLTARIAWQAIHCGFVPTPDLSALPADWKVER